MKSVKVGCLVGIRRHQALRSYVKCEQCSSEYNRVINSFARSNSLINRLTKDVCLIIQVSKVNVVHVNV